MIEIVIGVLAIPVAGLIIWGATHKGTDISTLPKGDSGTLRTDSQ